MLGETMLVPPSGPLPDTFSFFKRVHAIPENTAIKIYSQRLGRFVQLTTFSSQVHDTYIQCVTKVPHRTEPFLLDSRRDHIMEVDPVPGTILNPRLENIKGEKEDALVLAILDDPSRIPTFLWKRPSFLHKMQKVGFTDRKTEESLRKTNVYGSLPKSWPDVTREQVFKQLGIKDNTNEADARAIMAEECIAPDCFLSGGKNKKKRYGRL
jgi:hypothetical protein